MNTRPVAIAHLVFGLIFLGASALWAIGASTDADAPDLALMAPTVLIGAGVIGLIGILVNARNARRRAQELTGSHLTSSDPAYADTSTDVQEQP
jgi:hypothetical protein